MRMRRVVRAVSSFLIQLCAALLKTVVTTLIVGLVLVTLMHYMGIPVPSAADMIRGVERLADVLS